MFNEVSTISFQIGRKVYGVLLASLLVFSILCWHDFKLATTFAVISTAYFLVMYFYNRKVSRTKIT